MNYCGFFCRLSGLPGLIGGIFRGLFAVRVGRVGELFSVMIFSLGLVLFVGLLDMVGLTGLFDRFVFPNPILGGPALLVGLFSENRFGIVALTYFFIVI